MSKRIGMLFQADMIRALMRDVNPKTQTRRTHGLEDVNESPDDWKIFGQHYDREIKKWIVVFQHKEKPSNTIVCHAKAALGDVIYAKETFGIIPDDGGTVVYRATDPEWATEAGLKWKRSIFMPERYARIWLNVEKVWCERVQDITELDAESEGCKKSLEITPGRVPRGQVGHRTGYGLSFVKSYKLLWDEINGPGSWKRNPFVFCYQFSRTEKP